MNMNPMQMAAIMQETSLAERDVREADTKVEDLIQRLFAIRQTGGKEEVLHAAKSLELMMEYRESMARLKKALVMHKDRINSR